MFWVGVLAGTCAVCVFAYRGKIAWFFKALFATRSPVTDEPIDSVKAYEALTQAKREEHAVLMNDWLRDFGDDARPKPEERYAGYYTRNAVAKTWEAGRYTEAYATLNKWTVARDEKDCQCIDCIINAEKKYSWLLDKKVSELTKKVLWDNYDLGRAIYQVSDYPGGVASLRRSIPNWYYSTRLSTSEKEYWDKVVYERVE